MPRSAKRRVRRPHLLTGHAVDAAALLGARREAGEVAPGAGLAEQLAPDVVAGEDPRHPPRPLLLGAVRHQRRPDERDAGPTEERRRPGAGELLVVDRRPAPATRRGRRTRPASGCRPSRRRAACAATRGAASASSRVVATSTGGRRVLGEPRAQLVAEGLVWLAPCRRPCRSGPAGRPGDGLELGVLEQSVVAELAPDARTACTRRTVPRSCGPPPPPLMLTVPAWIAPRDLVRATWRRGATPRPPARSGCRWRSGPRPPRRRRGPPRRPGPKISSCAIVIELSTSANSVGSKKNPRSSPAGRPPPQTSRAPSAVPVGDVALDPASLRLADQRAHHHLRVGRVADADPSEDRRHALDDVVVDGAVGEDPGRQRATLTGVDREPGRRRRGELVEVGTGEDDVGRLAAELEEHLLQTLRGLAHDPLPDGIGSGEAHHVDAGMGREVFTRRRRRRSPR